MARKLKNVPALIFIILMLISIFVGLYLVSRSQDIRNKAFTSAASLSVVAPVGTTKVGQTTAVSLVLNTAGLHVSAAQMRLNYDPKKLRFESIAATGPLSVVLSQPKTVPGYVDLVLGCKPTTPVIGTFQIAVVRFTVIGSGASAVSLMPQATKLAATESTFDVLALNKSMLSATLNK